MSSSKIRVAAPAVSVHPVKPSLTNRSQKIMNKT